MKLEKLYKLKEKLQKETDLSKIWLYYMDEFGDIPEFSDLGEPVRQDFLLTVITQVCQQIFGKPTNIDNILTIYIKEYQFYHAPFLASNHIGGVIFFEDINTGLIAVTSAASKIAKYSRFTGIAKSDRHDRN
ncbi:hypothetical protein [Chamaesiphon sp. VAR_48_metabat_403]|uniref:hypothetical protein n=1 Tax=Chamaesiphon sp. VAR_48_metabat_403 TaxID=2964700 RepID=UPI00286DE5B8|nr:hypothetical protein [Chamaesiphon sp. VAR_48_metabat_403]